jgi:hypothetical protein
VPWSCWHDPTARSLPHRAGRHRSSPRSPIRSANPTAAGVREIAVSSTARPPAVTFAGDVAGTTYVVVRHADGLRLTYGNLEPVEVAQGDVVARGTRLGVTAGRFHLGLRDGERYVDPAPFLGVERRVVRLVPVDGSAANPSPLPRLVCGAGPSP